MKTQIEVIQSPEVLKNPSFSLSFRSFIVWANKMDYYRLIILTATILFQGCVTAPFTMWSMHAVYGFHDLQMSIITIGSFAVLVTNLSVQPMRITIPVFILSTFMQMAVIIVNLFSLLG